MRYEITRTTVSDRNILRFFSNAVGGFVLTILVVVLSGCQPAEDTLEVAQQGTNVQVTQNTDEAVSEINPADGRMNQTETDAAMRVAAELAEKDKAKEVAQDDSDDQSNSNGESDSDDPEPVKHTIKIPQNWQQLEPHDIWLDFNAKKIMFSGIICLDRGPLEMFICPANTKEHESVIASDAKSSEVHAALLAIGTNPGSPAQWDPKYKPASGPSIDVEVIWFDDETNKEVSKSGASMVLDSRTGKPMDQKWVFGGSVLWEDPDTGDHIYYGDSGELICLSNFSTATIDVNVKSSQANSGLLFEANENNIPAIGTRVYVVLKPGPLVKAEVVHEEAVKKEPATKKPDEKSDIEEPAKEESANETPAKEESVKDAPVKKDEAD